MARFLHLVLCLLSILIFAAAFQPARASCGTGVGDFRSGYYSPVQTTGGYFQFYPYATVTLDIAGSFWALGRGDPALDRGVDNGGYATLGGPYPFYGYNSWVYIYPYFLTRLDGSWSNPEIDGCIDDETSPECMAVVLSDQDLGQGYFALLSAEADAQGDFSFDQPIPPGEFRAPILMAPIPAPSVAGTSSVGGVLNVDVDLADVPDEALYLDAPNCDSGVILGYRIHQQTAAAGQPAPVDRTRDDGDPTTGWEVAIGGELVQGDPLPLGVPALIRASDCTDQGRLYLAATLVFDSGFELDHVSANGPTVECGTCVDVDVDLDGFGVGACAPRLLFDCDDDNAQVSPGAPQICDGLNNDCTHPNWPDLAFTSEVDIDGDGLSECQGDNCPNDFDNDIDGDGFCGDVDVCPELFNPDQTDTDGDELGDPCDTCPLDPDNNIDGDPFCGDVDNCPAVANPDQSDLDGDLIGDVCDDCPNDPDNDVDRDNICGDVDPCPLDRFNDADDDGICGDVDPCPVDPANDGDRDGFCSDVDNCPVDTNAGREDADGDALGDACDAFERVTVIEYIDDPTSVTAVDLDGDGDQDVVATDGNTDANEYLAWYENSVGDGSAWTRHSIDGGTFFRHVTEGDLDNDGEIDLVVARGSGVSWYQNVLGDGTQWLETTVSQGFPASIVVSDVDGDGDRDVVTAANGDVAWHENAIGDGSAWARHPIGDLFLARSVSAADADGDGDQDVFAAAGSIFGGPNDLVMYRNVAGDGSAWVASTVFTSSNFDVVATADVDGDGDMDLFSSTFRDISKILWHENTQGDGSDWVERVITAGAFSYDSLFPVDLDGDHDVDLISGDTFPDLISWHENRVGEGMEWKARTITEYDPLYPRVSGSDLDGDGDADVIATFQVFADRIEWHENIGLPSGGDNTPPTLLVQLSSATLWPPNHRMVNVHAAVAAEDDCGSTTVILESIISNEPDDTPDAGDGNTVNDIRDAEFGTADFDFRLRAERAGSGFGRTYTVAYTATDCSGNSTTESPQVSVPHDANGSVEEVMISVTDEGSGSVISWNAVDGAESYSVIRGRIANLRESVDAIELGPVSCVLGRTSATGTLGFEDVELPGQGETFFYLVGYRADHFSAYGTVSAAKPRIPSAGDCQ